jgi:motility quorum-sensing regulator/GCU-specific mRNA interferase toxin
MEKRRAHHNLEDIKAQFSDPELLSSITVSARNDARALGFSDEDIVLVIQNLMPRNLYKSMTSYHDHTLWQDVYWSAYRNVNLYVKFTAGEDGSYWLLSFKEKEQQERNP